MHDTAIVYAYVYSLLLAIALTARKLVAASHSSNQYENPKAYDNCIHIKSVIQRSLAGSWPRNHIAGAVSFAKPRGTIYLLGVRVLTHEFDLQGFAMISIIRPRPRRRSQDRSARSVRIRCDTTAKLNDSECLFNITSTVY